MINLNERPAMENYYLFKKLPEYTHIKDTGKDILKDSKFYNSKLKDNQWNNKYRFSRKYLTFFQDSYETDGLDKRLHLQQLEAQKEENMKEQHKAIINYMRNEALDRLHERKMERINVQLDSQQQIYNINEKNLRDLSIQDSTTKQKRIVRKIQQGTHHLTGRAPTLWNELNKTSQKHLNLSFNDKIIQKDSLAVESIQKRIEKDQQDEDLKNSLVRANMDKIRNTFKERSNQNYEFSQKILEKRTSPLPNPPTRSVLEINRVRSKSQLNPEIIDREERERQAAIRLKQYDEFLKQEREYVSNINSQYEVDKKKFNLPQSQSQNNNNNSNTVQAARQNAIASYNSNPTSQSSQQGNLQTFGAVVHSSQNSDLNYSIQTDSFNNRINNIYNSQSQIENQNPFDVNASVITLDQKQSLNQTPMGARQQQQQQIISQYNASMSSLSNEQIPQKRIQQHSSIFGNTSISQILEKPLNLLELKNTADLTDETPDQKHNKKATPLKSSLKGRSYSQNTQENLAAIKDYTNSLLENPYNPSNDVTQSDISKSKEFKTNNNNNNNDTESQIQNESQLNVTAKKVNFHKEDSFLEYRTAPSSLQENRQHQYLLNKDSFQVNDQDFSIDTKYQSRSGIDQNRYSNSASLSATSNFPLKYIKTPIIHKQNHHLNDLSQPKSEKFPPKFTDKSDFRGLLSGELGKLDAKLNNSFVKTMTSYSQIVRDQTLNSTDFRTTSQTKKRYSSTSKQPSTTYSDIDSSSANKQNSNLYYSIAADPEMKSYVDAFDKFDDEFSTNNIRRCFPGKSLNEYRKTVKDFQRIKEKDQTIDVKKKTIPSISPQRSLNDSKIHHSFYQHQSQNSRIIQ